jgi:hypothetical protein
MKTIGLVILGLLATDTLFAQTSPLSYDYVNLDLGSGDVDDIDLDFYKVGASFSITESLFVSGSYNDAATEDDVDVGIGSGKIELSNYELGIGFHGSLNPTADFVVSASYINAEGEIFGFSEHDDGLGVGAGLRFKPTGRVELNVFGEYVDVGDDGEAGYSVSAYYFLVPTFSVGLVYEGADDMDTHALSLRLHF